MMRRLSALLLLFPLLATASPRDEDFPAIPPTVPDEWLGYFEGVVPRDQKLAQTVVADLDRDGEDDWILLTEPKRGRGKVWAHIYSPPSGGTDPQLKWRAPLYGENFSMIRGFLTEFRPIGQVLVVVQAEPFHTGDSRFRVQVIGWHLGIFRQLVPEHAEFRSQGGFTIEPAKEGYVGDSLLVWSHLRNQEDPLYDYHHYEYVRFHFDGNRWAVQDVPDRTQVKHPYPESAGVEAGATGPDLRRRIDGIAEVP